MHRKYLPTLSELIDRLSIVQLKEVFIPEHKEEYAKEIADICHDINMCLSQVEAVDADVIRAIVVLSRALYLGLQRRVSRARAPAATLSFAFRVRSPSVRELGPLTNPRELEARLTFLTNRPNVPMNE